MERAERRVAELKKAVTDQVIALASLSDRSERLRVVRYLYWNERRVNSGALTAALLVDWSRAGGQAGVADLDLARFQRWSSKMREMVGPIGTRECQTGDCTERVPVTSRTSLEKGSGARYCEQCARCPRRPAPCKNWGPVVAQERRKQGDYEARYRRGVEQARAELDQLKDRVNLDENELVRLLMSHFDDDHLGRRIR